MQLRIKIVASIKVNMLDVLVAFLHNVDILKFPKI